MPDFARPASQLAEFAKLLLKDEMSANAPAAMYFVISVLPISMTSGVLPPASVASNFCRCVPHDWYCTFAVAPVSFWNCAFAAATIGAQFAACASVWSQIVMLLALFAPETPPAAIAKTSAARATKPTATNFRLFIDEPSIALAGLLLAALRARASARRIGMYHSPSRGGDWHILVRMSRPLWSGAEAVAVERNRDVGNTQHWPHAQLGDEPVAVASVDRAHELDHLGLGAGEPLEQERRRVERDAERPGLLLVGHRRLDRLLPADDRDPVAIPQERIERAVFEILRGQVGNQRLPHVKGLDCERIPVREPKPLGDDDPLRRGDVKNAAQPRACGHDAQVERLAAGRHAAGTDLVGERAHRQLLRDLRLADECPRPAPTDELAFPDEVIEGSPDRQARD